MLPPARGGFGRRRLTGHGLMLSALPRAPVLGCCWEQLGRLGEEASSANQPTSQTSTQRAALCPVCPSPARTLCFEVITPACGGSCPRCRAGKEHPQLWN